MSRAPAPGLRRALGWFLVFNAISLALVLGLYQLVWHGEFMTPAFEATYAYFGRHQTQAVLAAAMPFFAALLVGWGYARRAARRRRAAGADQAS